MAVVPQSPAPASVGAPIVPTSVGGAPAAHFSRVRETDAPHVV